MKATYEWDIETTDEHGDIIDHNHVDELKEYTERELGELKSGNLVLVRDDDYSRGWAYVEKGKLPEYITDACGCNIVKVPQKFHNELKKHLKN